MQRVFRLQAGKLVIEVAGFLKIAALHKGVRQQLHYFIEVRIVAGLLQKAQHKLQARNAFTDTINQRIQRIEKDGRAPDQEALGIAVIEFQGFFEILVGDKPFSQAG